MFRAYDPYSGRWLSRDPAGEFIGGINLYEYADGNPVDKIDPLLGILYQNRPQHGVKKPNKEGQTLGHFSSLFAKSLV